MSRVLRPIPLGKRRGLLNAAFRTPAYPGDAVVTLQTPPPYFARRVCRWGLLYEGAGLYRLSRSLGLTPRFKYFPPQEAFLGRNGLERITPNTPNA